MVRYLPRIPRALVRRSGTQATSGARARSWWVRFDPASLARGRSLTRAACSLRRRAPAPCRPCRVPVRTRPPRVCHAPPAPAPARRSVLALPRPGEALARALRSPRDRPFALRPRATPPRPCSRHSGPHRASTTRLAPVRAARGSQSRALASARLRRPVSGPARLALSWPDSVPRWPISRPRARPANGRLRRATARALAAPACRAVDGRLPRVRPPEFD